MINEQKNHIKALEKFSLNFEYNQTWHEAKKSTRARATK